MVALRKEFVFDNVAVYLQDEETQNLEVALCACHGTFQGCGSRCCLGRGLCRAGASKKAQLLLQDPSPGISSDDRLHQAYLLGLPLHQGRLVKGAVVFVRFGGPVYEDQHVPLPLLPRSLLSMLFERATWDRNCAKNYVN